VQAVIPAVVHVSAIQKPSGISVGYENSAGIGRSKHQGADRDLPPAALDEVLRRFFSTPDVPIRSTGSGFIIDPAGFIVTEDHVVESRRVTVTFQDGKRHAARIIGRDPKTGLALLKIDVDQPLPSVGCGDSDTARVGDWVFAIGNPFGLDATVTSGIISGRGRDLHLGPYDDFLQIDAAINLGNSGGPTFDLDGKVIGVNTAIYTPNVGSVGIGFAVPANLAQPVIAQLKARGKVERGWLGVRLQDLTPELAEGGLVADVTPDGPAARAGFALGDVILAVNGRSITKKRDLLVALASIPAGQRAEIRVWRRDAETVLRPVIGEMPESLQITANAPRESRAPRKEVIVGLNLAPLNEAQRELLQIPPKIKGVIVLSIDDDSAFLRLGIRGGDVIENINERPVTSPAEATARLKEALASPRRNVLMLVNRNGTNRFLAMSLENAPNGRDDG
jgi:serine protease Do